MDKVSVHQYFEVLHVNFKISLRHLVLLELIYFEKMFKRLHGSLQCTINNLGTQVFVHLYVTRTSGEFLPP